MSTRQQHGLGPAPGGERQAGGRRQDPGHGSPLPPGPGPAAGGSPLPPGPGPAAGGSPLPPDPDRADEIEPDGT